MTRVLAPLQGFRRRFTLLRGQDQRGSTIPLILGFFLLALLMVAGSIALGDAFVQQRELQDVCDGAASAAAASAADLTRGGGLGSGADLQFADVQRRVDAYLSRDAGRRDVHVTARLSADRRRITLHCEQTTDVAFGGFFGRRHVRHTATSSARSELRG
ncbi:MAG TPA: pilus assembly protein TadG-related protein [Jatrophihabitans sp.]|nr:pilus assembly protein TadG-related protein [Jatrophihabitans sp.]